VRSPRRQALYPSILPPPSRQQETSVHAHHDKNWSQDEPHDIVRLSWRQHLPSERQIHMQRRGDHHKICVAPGPWPVPKTGPTHLHTRSMEHVPTNSNLADQPHPGAFDAVYHLDLHAFDHRAPDARSLDPKRSLDRQPLDLSTLDVQSLDQENLDQKALSPETPDPSSRVHRDHHPSSRIHRHHRPQPPPPDKGQDQDAVLSEELEAGGCWRIRRIGH
ncbi:hypothetical protein QBC39DRAFT_404400, partial [Podospora conica]